MPPPLIEQPEVATKTKDLGTVNGVAITYQRSIGVDYGNPFPRWRVWDAIECRKDGRSVVYPVMGKRVVALDGDSDLMKLDLYSCVPMEEAGADLDLPKIAQRAIDYVEGRA